MHLARRHVATPLLALLLSASASVLAQAQLKAGASGRGSSTVALSLPRVEGQPAAKPMIISVDYGAPAARGREVAGALAADLGKVWRLGANEATTFHTDVDLDVGGTMVSKGTYSLFAETTKGSWKLIISKRTGEWGTDYDPKADLARIPLTERVLATAVEIHSMWLIPVADGAKGELRFAWGTLEHSVSWAVK